MNFVRPLFSIVIVNYNHGSFLEEAIKSVLYQSCKDFELIIVDGGSTDNSKVIIESYGERLAWWVSEKDGGQSNAFNKGFRKAKGEFFLWLNADDFLLADSLLSFQREIRKSKKSWYVADTVFFDEKGKVIKCAAGPNWNGWLIRRGSMYVYGPSAVFHRDLFKRLEGFDESLNYAMDTDFWLRLFRAGETFTRVRHFAWAFRIHSASKTSHVFSEKPNSDYERERRFISAKNNYRPTFFGRVALFFYKCLVGCYALSAFKTLQLRGRDIRDLV